MDTYSVSAKGVSEAEVWIYDNIGEYWGGVTAKQFASDITKMGSGLKKIDLHINSPGGNVFDGIAIYNFLKQHKAVVAVTIDGLAASIASVIAMAGNEISMASNALMMVHNAWTPAMGNASDLRKTANELELLDQSILSAYSSRSKTDENTIKKLMDAETWMGSDDAIKYGLADYLSDPVEMAARFDLSKFGFKNPPSPAAVPSSDSTKNVLARMNMRSSKIKAARGR